MTSYVLIETRDPWESGDLANWQQVATGLVAEGNQVTYFLVQNGVLPARANATASRQLKALIDAGVKVVADDFSLRERGIASDGLLAGISVEPIDAVIDHMASGSIVIWH